MLWWRVVPLLLLGGLLFATCGDGDEGPSPTVTLVPTETPAAARTGIPELDAVLEAVLSHDAEAVRPLIDFETVACIGPTPGSLGALFCKEGETPGTRVEALRAAQCEGHYIRADEMNQALQSMTDATVELYAVARTDDGHRAVFSRLVGPDRETAAGYAVLIEEGRVTFVDFGCGDTAEELVERVPPENFVLPPPTPTATAPASATMPPSATATPHSGRAGIPEVDTVLDVLFSGDKEAVRALVRFTGVPCAVKPQGIGAPPACPQGVADGTPVDVFPAAACEGFYLEPDGMDYTLTTLATSGPELAAVYRARGGHWPPGDYVAIYTGMGDPRRSEFAYGVVMEDGRIVGAHAGCAMTPERYVEFFRLEDALVPLPTTE